MKNNPSASPEEPEDQTTFPAAGFVMETIKLPEWALTEPNTDFRPLGDAPLVVEGQELPACHPGNIYTAILNALPAQAAIIDREGVILYVNDRWREDSQQNGIHHGGFAVGQNYLTPYETEEITPTKVAAGIRAVLAGAATKFSVEYPYNNSAAQTWHQLTATPLDKNCAVGAIIMNVDVTQQKLNQEVVRHSQEQFHNMFIAAAIGVAISTPRGPYLHANSAYCQMLGYTEAELRSRTLVSLIHPDDLAISLAMREELLTGERASFNIEKRYLKKNGDIVWTRCSVAATHTEEGILSTFMVVAEDITERKQAEAQVLWKTALLEAQVNSSPDGILVVGNDGTTSLHNQRLMDLWDFPVPGASGLAFPRLMDAIVGQVKNSEQFIEKIVRFYEHPDEIDHDEVELKNGKCLDRYSAPVLGRDGEHHGRIWTFREITERKSEQKKATEQMELMRMAGRVAKLGAWALEYPGPTLIWSEEVYRIHDLDPEFKPELGSTLKFYPPESREKLERAIETGQPLDLTFDFVTNKGKKKWVHITSAVEVNDGKVSRIHGIFKDITERKQTEARFRLLADSNVQGVFFWNRNGKITGANDAFLKLVGHSRSELEAGGVDWMALTPPEYSHLDRQCLDEIDNKGFGAPYEKELVLVDGSRVPILLGAASFEDNREEGVCFVVDLTERKKIELQFLRAQRMEGIGTLAGGIAHDLNNILAPIVMSIDLLKELSNDPESKDILDTIELSAKRGADIVRQVLSFARGVEGERASVRPMDLLNDLEQIIKDTFPKDIRLRFVTPSDVCMILGDHTQVHQILLNLCINARDAMPNGGCLTVAAENCELDEHYAAMNSITKAGRYVLISVTDSGIGMPREILGKIFEPFFTTKEVGSGSGLGLSTVMAIAKSHGGVVNVYSELGKGTTFKIYLPALGACSDEHRNLSQDTPLPRGKGETVLLVDDEASILSITSKTLRSFGYQVLTATDGAEAIGTYLEHKDKIAVLLTDMMMPIMDGTAAIHALQKINPRLKIIAASGLNSHREVTNIAGIGIKNFLTKPYTAETLLKTIHATLVQA